MIIFSLAAQTTVLILDDNLEIETHVGFERTKLFDLFKAFYEIESSRKSDFLKPFFP